MQDAVVKSCISFCCSLLQTVAVEWAYSTYGWCWMLQASEVIGSSMLFTEIQILFDPLSVSDLFWQRKSTSARELFSSRRTARWRAVSLVPLKARKREQIKSQKRPVSLSQSLQVAEFCTGQSRLEYSDAKGEELVVQLSIYVCVLVSECVYLHV